LRSAKKSLFSKNFPSQQPRPGPPWSKNRTIVDDSAAPRRIVDDSAAPRRVVAVSLSGVGDEVIEVSDGVAALRRPASELAPMLMLMLMLTSGSPVGKSARSSGAALRLIGPSAAVREVFATLDLAGFFADPLPPPALLAH
jgi:hypothetical protein